jgi:hypothetical protein
VRSRVLPYTHTREAMSDRGRFQGGYVKWRGKLWKGARINWLRALGRYPGHPYPHPRVTWLIDSASHHLHRAPYSILSYIGNHIAIHIIALHLCQPIMEGGPDAVMSTKSDGVLVLEGGWAVCAFCLSSVQFVLTCHYMHREPSLPPFPSPSLPHSPLVPLLARSPIMPPCPIYDLLSVLLIISRQLQC